ncbi:hypothetical protein [Parendozoicomonas haliclonae]|uniref:Uncharacterized protein n=1 Tax=Parendozoicomonas haliclonae TaxID=1960125 RepID=A0A1X7AHA8_9GAMM|nr:hypothetical protein [Parendozoicomonas haliclonae]SMA40622.1 hypothetical protein EHSB41UT_01214 [Parendozoicomonas haliclonae]
MILIRDLVQRCLLPKTLSFARPQSDARTSRGVRLSVLSALGFYLVSGILSAAFASPVQPIYLVVYTGHIANTQEGSNVVLGAERIPAKSLMIGEGEDPELRLYSYIQTSPDCATTGACSPVSIQTSTHFSDITGEGAGREFSVHTAHIHLGNNLPEGFKPIGFLNKGIDEEEKLESGVSVFMRDGTLFPLLEVTVPQKPEKPSTDKKEAHHTLVAGRFEPPSHYPVITLGTFPPKGTLVVDSGDYRHGLALFSQSSRTFKTEKNENPTESPVLYYSGKKTQGKEPDVKAISLLPHTVDTKPSSSEPETSSDMTDIPDMHVDITGSTAPVHKLLNTPVIQPKSPMVKGVPVEVEYYAPPDQIPSNPFLGLYSQNRQAGNDYKGFAKLTKGTEHSGPHTVSITPNLKSDDEQWVHFYIGENASGYMSSNYQLTDIKSASFHVADKPLPEPMETEPTTATLTVAPYGHMTRTARLSDKNQQILEMQRKMETVEKEAKLKQVDSDETVAQVMQNLTEQNEEVLKLQTQIKELSLENQRMKKNTSGASAPQPQTMHKDKKLTCKLWTTKGGQCDQSNTWSSKAYISHLDRKHASQTIITSEDICPGCNGKVQDILYGSNDMSAFKAHIHACQGFNPMKPQ